MTDKFSKNRFEQDIDDEIRELQKKKDILKENGNIHPLLRALGVGGVIGIVFIFVVALGIVGYLYIAKNKDMKDLKKQYSNYIPITSCPKANSKTEYIEDEYLTTNACRLYTNYKDLYLTMDEICNDDYTCRGSATQKEGYETFKTWDSFKESYCKE